MNPYYLDLDTAEMSPAIEIWALLAHVHALVKTRAFPTEFSQ